MYWFDDKSIHTILRAAPYCYILPREHEIYQWTIGYKVSKLSYILLMGDMLKSEL